MMSIPDSFILLERYKQEVLSPLLPYIVYTDGGFNNFGTSGSLSFDFFGDSNNFRNSKFEVPNTPELLLIHFTKAASILSILNSREIWLSKLANLNDQSEFVFADKYFQNDHFDSNTEAKNQIFSLSSCACSTETINDERMWIDYGDNHTGVCMKFKLIKAIYYEDIYLGKIQYDEDPITELIDLKKRHDVFSRLNHNHQTTFGNSLYFISSFYKLKSKYQNEKEIRIIKYLQECYDSSDDFYKLPILANEENKTYIKIEDIIFGKEIDSELKYQIEYAFGEYLKHE